MRKLMLAATAAIFWAAPARSQEGDSRAAIEKAIQAQGGAAALTKASAGFRKVQGVFHSDNWKFIGESYSDAENRVKITLKAEGEVRVLAMNGPAKGWMSFNDAIFDFDEKTRQRMVKSAHADRVAGLMDLLSDRGFKLTATGQSRVKEAAALGVKVQYAGMPDMQLYFDKASGLLIKTAYRTTDANTEQEVFQEVYYSNFATFDPAAEPLQALRSGSEKLDLTAPALLRHLQEHIPDESERQKIELLMPELGRASFSARQKASSALQKYGAKAAAFLRQGLASDDNEVVRRCEQLLKQIGQSGQREQATSVIRLLAVRRPGGAAEGLLAYYPWADDDGVAREVLFALAALVEVDPKAKKLLEAALADADAQKRAAARQVLGKDGGAFLKQPWRRVLVEGVHFARTVQIFREGRPFLHMDTFEHVFYNHFDDALFARPGS